MKKYVIKVSTSWCGMNEYYAAFAETEDELSETADELARDNFDSYGCFDLVLKDLFPDRDYDDDYTEEEQNLINEECANNTFYEIYESDDDEVFDTLTIVYGEKTDDVE